MNSVFIILFMHAIDQIKYRPFFSKALIVSCWGRVYQLYKYRCWMLHHIFNSFFFLYKTKLIKFIYCLNGRQLHNYIARNLMLCVIYSLKRLPLLLFWNIKKDEKQWKDKIWAQYTKSKANHCMTIKIYACLLQTHKINFNNFFTIFLFVFSHFLQL